MTEPIWITPDSDRMATGRAFCYEPSTGVILTFMGCKWEACKDIINNSAEKDRFKHDML